MGAGEVEIEHFSSAAWAVIKESCNTDLLCNTDILTDRNEWLMAVSVSAPK